MIEATYISNVEVQAGVRLRFGFGATDDADGLREDHDGFVEARWDALGPSVIEKGFKIGTASDFWNRYEEDIQLAKDLGVQSWGSTQFNEWFVVTVESSTKGWDSTGTRGIG